MAQATPHFPDRPKPARRSPALGCFFGILQWFFDLTRFWIYIILFFALMALASYGIVSHYVRGKEIEAPDLSGLTVDEALKRLTSDPLRSARLSLSLERTQPHESARKDTIISQQPEPKSRIKAGSPIKIILSDGPPLVTVPDLRGQSRERAATLLRRYNLRLGSEATLNQPGKPGGLVIITDPPGGTGITEGSPVNLLLTAGASQSNAMPDLVGLTLDEVNETLARRKLPPAQNVERTTGGDAIPGQVIDQMPKAGQLLQPDTQIIVYYEAVLPVPNESDTQPPAEAGENRPADPRQVDTGTASPEVDDADPRNSGPVPAPDAQPDLPAASPEPTGPTGPPAATPDAPQPTASLPSPAGQPPADSAPPEPAETPQPSSDLPMPAPE